MVEQALKSEQELREDLVTAFRWTARHDLHDGVANHFSVATNEDGTEFLMNPSAMHFSHIKASDLLLLNANDDSVTKSTTNAPDPTAWCLHSYVHKHMPEARCIIHTHSPYVATLATLKDPTIHAICQTTAMFYSKTAYDLNFGGVLVEESEGEKFVKLMQGGKKVLMMGGHGIMTIGKTVGEAFELAYYAERAAKTVVMAYQTGQELNYLPTQIAESTERQLDEYENNGKMGYDSHLAELKRILDEQEPEYKT